MLSSFHRFVSILRPLIDLSNPLPLCATSATILLCFLFWIGLFLPFSSSNSLAKVVLSKLNQLDYLYLVKLVQLFIHWYHLHLIHPLVASLYHLQALLYPPLIQSFPTLSISLLILKVLHLEILMFSDLVLPLAILIVDFLNFVSFTIFNLEYA